MDFICVVNYGAIISFSRDKFLRLCTISKYPAIFKAILMFIFGNFVRFLTLSFLLLTACAGVDDYRTPQQKNLNPKAFDTLSTPEDDFALDPEDDESFEEEIDRDPVIHENFYKQISISVSENMKMREVLTKMADLAGVNIFIVQDVEGQMSFQAKGRPFLDILKDICSGAGLKYSINGNSVKIEYDSPMLKIYNVQFLNIQRDMESTVSISTDIFMNQSIGTKGEISTTGSSGSTNNGSSSLVAGKTKNDFWSELEEALKIIIGEKDGSYVSVHRQGGLITVYTTQSKHDEIQKYLRILKDTTESQVLIEAKILEVNLNDEYRSGINWNIMRSGGAIIGKEFSERTGLFTAGIDRKNLSIVAGLIEKFGAVKTLSSPRITVLNNQSAILKVAKNEVIYLPELQRQYATMSDNRSTDFLSTTIHTIPIGLVMSVQPSVDKKNNTILLNLRPTISRIAEYKKVPFFYNATVKTTDSTDGNTTQQVQSQEIPIVDVRELDSILRLNSGQIVVMGGLMYEKSRNNRDGLPEFKELDFIAGSNTKTTDVTELVIFLKATILRRKSPAHHNADKKIYDTFANDPRPLRFKK
ncbi:MAG: secretin N-terminal domain-containing protein [Holosporaceae bacterium]|jgi:general secretion pathway protein D|nr:secretin N-terminal domain-containing protein [Holosporaceae bacterium]